MITEMLTVDVAAGTVMFGEEEVDVAVAILTHIETGHTVWESAIAVPFQVEDWLARVMTHHRTIKAQMEYHWPEVAAYTCWWLVEPGTDEDNPHGLQV